MTARGTLSDALSAGWTGGQYSLTRVVAGVYLLVAFGRILLTAPATVVASDTAGSRGLPYALATVAGVAGAAALAAGVQARAASAVMLIALLGLATETPLVSQPWATAAALLILLHAIAPPAPYGSWAARARVDPRGGWGMPAAIVAGAWMAVWCLPAVAPLALPLWAGLGLGLVTLLVPGLAPLRGAVWLGLLLFLLADLATGQRVAAPIVTGLLLLLAFDPRWIPARLPGRRDQLFYDGSCGLCHGTVRFLLAEDRSAAAFTFGALQGETWESSVPAAQRRTLPDSVVVRTDEGELLTRSTGVAHLLERLGGFWRVLGATLRVLPQGVRDGAYDLVARVRYGIFGRKNALCPLLPPDLRTRFLN
jgi:predicted DCC family thiol-disulfide oxidoreductase YuxK